MPKRWSCFLVCFSFARGTKCMFVPSAPHAASSEEAPVCISLISLNFSWRQRGKISMSFKGCHFCGNSHKQGLCRCQKTFRTDVSSGKISDVYSARNHSLQIWGRVSFYCPLSLSSKGIVCEYNWLIDRHLMEPAHLSFSEKAASEPKDRNILICCTIK